MYLEIYYKFNILNMNQKFSNGSIVWLRSGSPSMTIDVFHNPTKRYRCNWFIGTELKYGEFTEDALTDTDTTNS
jgi:uncharacterized protein YodC (DUF2158 family)